MMAEHKLRILVVSGRILMAQGIVSLLEAAPRIGQVEVANNLYDALIYCKQAPPDALVIDLPSGADYFVDRPLSVEGKEIKTIVLLEEEKDGKAHLYVHTPRRKADLTNLLAAILLDGENYIEETLKNHLAPTPHSGVARRSERTSHSAAPAVQPKSFIKAKASGPKSSRISVSNPEL